MRILRLALPHIITYLGASVDQTSMRTLGCDAEARSVEDRRHGRVAALAWTDDGGPSGAVAGFAHAARDVLGIWRLRRRPRDRARLHGDPRAAADAQGLRPRRSRARLHDVHGNRPGSGPDPGPDRLERRGDPRPGADHIH